MVPEQTQHETLVEQLRSTLSKNFNRVINLFRDWDFDGSGKVSRNEFRKAMPMLDIQVGSGVAEQLFDFFDADGSGEIDFRELQQHLRPGARIELDAELQSGGAGEIVLEAKNMIATRAALSDKQRLEASALQGVALVEGDAASVAEQLLQALDTNLIRIIDLFREWDDDDSGTISKKEFRRALPGLGLKVSKEVADALFDSFDPDHSGSIDYNELHRAIKRKSISKKEHPNGVVKEANPERSQARRPRPETIFDRLASGGKGRAADRPPTKPNQQDCDAASAKPPIPVMSWEIEAERLDAAYARLFPPELHAAIPALPHSHSPVLDSRIPSSDPPDDKEGARERDAIVPLNRLIDEAKRQRQRSERARTVYSEHGLLRLDSHGY